MEAITAKFNKLFQLSLSKSILIGFGLGVVCGLFFGEYCAWLQVIGNTFIKLLQMTILPYIVVSLIGGLGRMTHGDAKLLAGKAGAFILFFWGVGIVVILLMPLAFPTWKTSAFFSSSLVEAKEPFNFFELYIPSNPFSSLAKNFIPAVVLFSIAVGIALISIKDKENVIQGFSVFTEAFTGIARFVIKLTPIGVFALIASATGTLTLEELGRLQVYIITYIAAALLLTFWILPALLTAFTPFKYKDILSLSKDALVTAFAASSLFVTLPILIKTCNEMFAKYKLRHKDSSTFIDIIIPVFFNFPSLGTLLSILFILFAAWFSGGQLFIYEYPLLVFSGVFSFFANPFIAIPIILDIMKIPADLFQLYIIAAIIILRFGVLLAAMHVLTFTLTVTCAITGFLSVQWHKLFKFSVITIAIMAGILVSCHALFSRTMQNAYAKDKVIASMQLLQNPVPALVHKTIPPVATASNTEKSRLKRIRESGVLRVGYRTDWLPFSYFNSNGDLVGFDIDMAHRLAAELGVSLEFIPVTIETLAQQIQDDHFDIVMAGFAVTPDRLEVMNFSDSYLDVTFAIAVEDHRRNEFATIKNIRNMKELRIGLPGQSYFLAKVQKALPHATVVGINSYRDFYEGNKHNLDAVLTSAEGGSAWTLLYPGYQVVVPKPRIIYQPLAYPIAGRDQEMVNFMNRWIELKKKDKTIEQTYNYWILGKGVILKAPRWSIIRNVLHWVE